jgi:DNA polymerase-3 subunit epsilon
VIRFPWQHRPPADPIAAAYLTATDRKLDRETPLDSIPFVVVDAETTGFDAARDRILSLATATVKAGTLQVATIRSWLVRYADTPLTPAVNVHGILPADSRSGEPIEAVLHELLPMLAGGILVGHHVDFDLAMLNAALDRAFGIRLRNPTLDTAELAMNVLDAFRRTGYARQRRPSLEEVCTHCGIAPLDRHTAPGDAFTTAELLMTLCAKQARQLGRPLTLRDLPLGK